MPIAAAALLVAVHYAVGGVFADGFRLDLGSLNEPAPRHGRFLALWTFFGALAAATLTLGLLRLGHGRGSRIAVVWRESASGKWLIYGTIFAFLIPALIRTLILAGAPLTDDESAYRFMARVLASGRLYADSPPFKLFFDNRFLINDGKLYAPYFLGWPALMAPGVWLGVTGYMNALYSALTVPPLYLLLRRLAGEGWARVGLILYLASPMLMIGAATETSHTSCIFALAWFGFLFFESRRRDAPWWLHSLLAVAFSVAFFVRPSSALGVGVPFLVVWGWDRWRALRSRETPSPVERAAVAGRSPIVALVAFVLPALVLAGAFLTVNRVQNGGFLVTGYARHAGYAEENGYRFSVVTAREAPTSIPPRSLRRSLALAGTALFRLDHDLFGWPSSLLFVFFAGARGPARLFLLAVACYFAVHLIAHDVGVDTYGPMHYLELGWPLVVLTVLGLARATELARRLPATGWRPAALPSTLALALVLVSTAGFLPVRLAAVHGIAENVALPRTALERAEISRAVVFAPRYFIVYCHAPPLEGWVLARPDNHPDLVDDVLWLNHLSVEADRELMTRLFPDRRGWVMLWRRPCDVVYLPLDALAPGSVPAADVEGIDEVFTP